MVLILALARFVLHHFLLLLLRWAPCRGHITVQDVRSTNRANRANRARSVALLFWTVQRQCRRMNVRSAIDDAVHPYGTARWKRE